MTKPVNERNLSKYSETDSNQLLLLIDGDQYNTQAKDELIKRGFKIKKKPSGGFTISKK